MEEEAPRILRETPVIEGRRGLNQFFELMIPSAFHNSGLEISEHYMPALNTSNIFYRQAITGERYVNIYESTLMRAEKRAKESGKELRRGAKEINPSKDAFLSLYADQALFCYSFFSYPITKGFDRELAAKIFLRFSKKQNNNNMKMISENLEAYTDSVWRFHKEIKCSFIEEILRRQYLQSFGYDSIRARYLYNEATMLLERMDTDD